jgi:hypothetical protein
MILGRVATRPIRPADIADQIGIDIMAHTSA